MTTNYARLLVAATLSLTLAGGLAACGDDHPGHADGSNPPATTRTATTPATAASVDAAFVRQMIPHHQMAIDMAKTAQQQAEHEELGALADDVVGAQSKEISDLLIIGERVGASADAGGQHLAADAETLGLPADELGMAMHGDHLAHAENFDVAFIDAMVPHHEGAVAMAKAQLASGQDPELRQLSKAIVAAQEGEIEQLQAWRQEWAG